jgi:hypothetical protein
MASGWFGKSNETSTRPPDIQVQIADREPTNFFLPSSNRAATPYTPPAGSVDSTHSKIHVQNASLFDVGILRDTLAPSFGLHSGLAVIAWGAARYSRRVEAKDWYVAP